MPNDGSGGTVPQGQGRSSDAVEQLRLWLAFGLGVIGIGIAAYLAMHVSANVEKWTEGGVTGLVGLFTGILGTLVGAFFGMQIGASGKDAAVKAASAGSEHAADMAEKLRADYKEFFQQAQQQSLAESLQSTAALENPAPAHGPAPDVIL